MRASASDASVARSLARADRRASGAGNVCESRGVRVVRRRAREARERDVAVRVARGERHEREKREEEEAYAEFVEEARRWTAYDPESPDQTPPWEASLRDAVREGPWPCWDSNIPESDFVDEPRFISFASAPEKYDPFKERVMAYKAKVKAQNKAMMKKTREEVKSQRFMSMSQDIRLKNKYEDDESAWDHEKIVELINFPDDIRAKMMSMSVEIYDPRVPYDFTGMGAPPPTTEEFLDSIGRLQPEGESDLERVAKIAAMYGSKVPELVEEDPAAILQTRSDYELQSAMDIGDDENDMAGIEISELIDGDD